MGTFCILVVHRPDQTVDELMEPFSDWREGPVEDVPCDHCNRYVPDLSCAWCRGTGSHKSTWSPVAGWSSETVSCQNCNPHHPDASCAYCRGTGACIRPRNPAARWDGYDIGGACTGALVGYDPSTDPDNWETCPFCQGTGQRPATMALNPELGCNGCHGQGRRMKYPSKWKPYPGDTLPVPELLRRSPDFIPCAVLTPRGEWIEEGLEHWLAPPSTPEEREARKPRLQALLETYPDCRATVVWCHF